MKTFTLEKSILGMSTIHHIMRILIHGGISHLARLSMFDSKFDFFHVDN